MDAKVLHGGKAQEADSKKSFIPNYRNRRPEEEIQKDLDNIKVNLKQVMGSELTFNEQMTKILELNSIIIPELFREFTSSMPNVDKSVIGSRILSAIKDMSGVIMKKHESEVAEEINTYSPKFQVIFTWFIELINVVLGRQGLDTIQINNIFADLSSELTGWEDKVSKRLKGLSAKSLDGVKNPLLDKNLHNNADGGFQL